MGDIIFREEKLINFFDPLEAKVVGNNRLYEKGMEVVLENFK